MPVLGLLLHLSITVDTNQFIKTSRLKLLLNTRSCHFHPPTGVNTIPELKRKKPGTLNQGLNQHPMSCPHVFPFLPDMRDMCHTHQCGMNAPNGWSMAKLDATWLRGSRTSVSQDRCMGCCPYMCETPAQVLAIWCGAEACLHRLREPMTWLQKRWLSC